MTISVLGPTLALAAAITVAISIICVRRGTEGATAQDAVLVVLLANFVIVVPLVGIVWYPDYGLTTRSLVGFAAAGIIGTMLGRWCYFSSVSHIGASRAEPIKASMPMHASVIAVLVLGETLTAPHFAGIVLIVVGVILITRQTTGETGARGGDNVTLGVTLAFIAALLYGIEPTIVKIGLDEGTPMEVGLAIKIAVGTVAYLGYLALRDGVPSIRSMSRPSLQWYLLAGITNTLFLGLYFWALAVAPVVIAIPIMQLSPLLVALFSLVLLRKLERITLPLIAATAVVVIGAMLVSLSG